METTPSGNDTLVRLEQDLNAAFSILVTGYPEIVLGISGYPVTRIENAAFRSCSNLTRVSCLMGSSPWERNLLFMFQSRRDYHS